MNNNAKLRKLTESERQRFQKLYGKKIKEDIEKRDRLLKNHNNYQDHLNIH